MLINLLRSRDLVACAKKDDGHKDVRAVEVVNGRLMTDPMCPKGKTRSSQNASIIDLATPHTVLRAAQTPAYIFTCRIELKMPYCLR